MARKKKKATRLPAAVSALRGKSADQLASPQRSKSNIARQRDLEIHTVIVRMTPDDAAKILETNCKNRSIREADVRKYADLMEAGKWDSYNGESISISKADELIDGQHRLWAIVYYGKPIDMAITFNVSDEAFKTIDINVRRQIRDTFEIEGEKHSTHLQPVITMLHNHLCGVQQTRGGVTPVEAMDTLNKHPGIRDSVDLMDEVRPPARLINRTIMAFVHYIGSRGGGREMADQFVIDVCTGENLKQTDPAMRLRNRLFNNMGIKTKLHRLEVLAITIKAWNVYARGDKMQQTPRWSKKTERFPLIIGEPRAWGTKRDKLIREREEKVTEHLRQLTKARLAKIKAAKCDA